MDTNMEESKMASKYQITVGNKRNGAKGIYVGRPSALGNPFIVGRDGPAGSLIEPYRSWLAERISQKDTKVLAALQEIKSQVEAQGSITLVCWCSPNPCHANVIRETVLGMTDLDEAT